MEEKKQYNAKVTAGPKVVSEYQGKKNIGFKIEGFENWFNIYDEEENLKALMPLLKTGNEVSFDCELGNVSNIKVLKEAQKQNDKKFGDDSTNFEELLDAAHKMFKGKFNIKTEMLQVDFEKKTAVFNAAVSIEYSDTDRRVFTAHGDSEGIGSDMIKPHFMRMAETRAIARALRWATNNAKVAEEELDQDSKK